MLESRFWRLGFTTDQDHTCSVVCKCGKDLFISSYRIFICPKCGRGYRTNFNCYRFSKLMIKILKLFGGIKKDE